MGITKWGEAARRAADKIRQNRLDALEKAGINYDFLIKKLLEELEAKEAKFFTYNGQIVNKLAVPDWNVRQRARMDAHKLRGDYPAEKIEGDLNTLVESLVSDRNTGTSVNTQTLTVSLKAIDYEAGVQMNLLAKGYPMAVVKDRNGVYHAVGIQDGIDFTVEQNTGGVKSDFNGYTLTGVATTSELSPKLDSATITAFLALIVTPT